MCPADTTGRCPSPQESLIRFSKFLQENDAKRARAERKAQEELRLAKQKVKEIDALQETLDGLKDEKEQTLEVLDKNLQYQQFLEQVLEVGNPPQTPPSHPPPPPPD